MRAGCNVSTLEHIRARDLGGMGTPSNQSAQDRRTLLALLDAQSLKLQAVREALDSVARYGLDTMSGPMENPPDLAAWYRDGVREMVHRARAALKQSRGAT